jgi:serpin B
MSKDLIELGARSAFSGKADFSGMTPKNELYISRVIHQAMVEVNEEGTEAAAATAAVFSKRMAPINRDIPKNFICDRPFLFIIHDDSHKCILFIGKYATP